MPGGPGKYDDACTAARIACEATGAALLVFHGNKGNGFSMQAPAYMMARLPGMLREMADEIERSIAAGGEGGTS